MVRVDMQTTIIPPAPSAEELAAEREAAAISRTGALIIAARYAGRTLSTRSNLRQAIQEMSQLVRAARGLS